MDIIRNDKIVEIKDMLFDKLKQDISFLEKRITIQERSVSNWKYATDEFYTLIPFEKELNKMKKGRILKNIQFDEDLLLLIFSPSAFLKKKNFY